MNAAKFFLTEREEQDFEFNKTGSKIRLRDDPILFQHSIEYGFIRNLLGGALIAAIISVVIIIYAFINVDSILRNTGLILLIIYLLPIIFSKLLISRYGKYYAKVFYEQFMSL